MENMTVDLKTDGRPLNHTFLWTPSAEINKHGVIIFDFGADGRTYVDDNGWCRENNDGSERGHGAYPTSDNFIFIQGAGKDEA